MDPEHTLPVGRAFGNYRVERLIGRGGMGSVFLAYDTTLHRYVALKVVEGSSQADTSRTRVLREARNAAALNHPNICTIHEVGDAGGTAFIAMEYIDGQPLRERLDGGPLPFNEVIAFGVQAADALAYAHEHGVIHRDFKAANAIIAGGRRLKIVDFGLAQRRDALVANTTTVASIASPGLAVGTPYAMAPEQVRGETADARSDVWALGVLLHEMAGGAAPFAGPTAPELFSAILRDEPAALPETVATELRTVIARCLEKDPARRFQSAAEVRAALETIQPGSVADRARIRGRRRLVLLSTATAIIVTSVLFGIRAGRLRSIVPSATTPRIESLAVLPLENLSGDAGQDYFADGMTEVLSTDLARLGGFKRVTARGSVVRYKKSSKPLADIARELKVDALLTGSIARSGDRISITAQLLDPVTGDQLWTNRYERDLRDVLVIRNEIVSSIVRELKAQLSPSAERQLASAQQVNPEAFEAYLKGHFYLLKQTREDYDVAERYFQLALEKDPNYAVAYAELGMTWMMRADAGFITPTIAWPKARDYMARALVLDSGLAEIHVSLGSQLAAVDWDWEGAAREYRLAIQANPNMADAHFFYGDLLGVNLNRREEANFELQRAVELDPLNEFNQTYIGWHLNYEHRYDEAITLFQRLLPSGPNRAANCLGLWGAHFRKGMYADAARWAREYFTAAGDGEFAENLSDATDDASYRAAARRTGEAMARRSTTRHVPAIRVARMFAHAGDADRAMDWLERAYQARESPLSRVAVFWDWDDLHDDPRFQNLLDRLHLAH